ncbi:MAG: GNAT family N-acetyltransferase [Alphaproteobacteria bacterium]|nr:GNAT family N-acetyltransferase [Alphaproteobacteria bacterium]
MKVEPVVLESAAIRLEPLAAGHEADLAAGLDPTLTQWFTKPLLTREDMRDYIAAALAGQAKGDMLPFATILRETGKAIGTTRFGAIDRANRRAEIGWTMVARPYQRSAVNSQAKLLMLAHAFETWGCIRVEFKTDSLNIQSRTALKRLGAVEEGILRNHMVCASGRIRHSVYFSITSEEWPSVKQRLIRRLAAGGNDKALVA